MNGSDRRRGRAAFACFACAARPLRARCKQDGNAPAGIPALAALYDHFIRRDAILARMLLPGKPVAAGFRHVVTGWPSSPIGLDFSRSSHHF
ncbi:hypothetical protein EOA53_12870 [Mesorhizobium sp. M1A.F.Ca.IN.020.03.1.1]|nr:hypothetical protein EOA53_12870 [Mesorhizobium sp. M1A.F.Ca.IN.020.03.1.1]